MNNTGSVMRPPPPKLYTKAGMELFANTQKTNGINGMTSSPNTNTFPNNSLPTNNPSTNNTGMILQNSSAQSSNIFMNRANNTVGIFNNNNTVNTSNANNNLNVFSNTANNNSNSSFPNTINNNNTSSSNNNNKPWINLSNSKNNPTITNGQTLNSNPIFSNNITNMGNNNMGSNMGNNNMGNNMGNIMGNNMGNIMGINNMGINNMGNNNTMLGRSITESPFSKSRNIFSNISKPRINDSVTLLKNQTFEPVRLIAHQKLKQSPNYVNCVASLPQNAKRILCKDEVRMEDYTNYYRQTGRHNFHQNYNHQQPRNSPIGQFTSLLQDKKKSATSMLEYSFFGNLVKQNPYHQINGQNEQHKSYQNINELQAHPLTYSIYDNDFYAKVQQRISQTYSENDHIFNILGLFSGESQQAQKFFRQFHPNLFVDIINKYQFYTYLKNKEKEHKPFYSSSHQNSDSRIDNRYENDYYLQNGIMGLDRFQGLSRRQQVDQFYDQYVETQLGQLFSDDQSIKHIFYNNKPLMYQILSRHQQIYNFLQTKTSQLIKPKTQLQSNYQHFYLPKRQTFDFRHSIQRNSAQRPKKNSLFSAYERQKYGKDKPLYNFGQESDQQSDQEVISVKLGQFQDQLKSFSYRLSDKIRFSYEA